MLFLVSNEDISFIEGLVFSIIAIVIVFLMLTLLVICIKLVSRIPFKNDAEVKTPKPVVKTTKKFSIEDIKDEDMMVAALVATANFVEETKCKDARLVSIKEVK